MDSDNKNILWALIIVMFYIVTAFTGIYNISILLSWPFVAIPLSIYVLKIGSLEMGALLGTLLSVLVSLIQTGTFDPLTVIMFLLFITLPSLVFGMLYNKKIKIPWIIMLTTITVIIGYIILIVFNKLLGIDYISMYFNALDHLKLLLHDILINNIEESLDQSVINANKQTISHMIRTAKRNYPAMLFIVSFIYSTLHLFIIQLLAMIMDWERPLMIDILKTGLSQVAAWSLVVLMFISYSVADEGTTLAFAVENMMGVLFYLFQIIGLISIISLSKKGNMNKIIRFMFIALSIVWFFINPIILVMIGCFDAIFNIRKVETLI